MRVTWRSAVAGLAVVVVLALLGWGVLDKPGAKPGASAPASPVAGHSQTGSRPPSHPATRATQGTQGRRGWKLKFNARFTGSRLNTKIWGTCYPWFHNVSAGCTNFGNGNEQKQWNLASQDRVAKGALELVAQPKPTRGKNRRGQPMMYGCRSGTVTTYPGFRFTYGYIQITARIPYGYGLWPALWLAAASLKWPPEIDILEHKGIQSNVGEFFHPVGQQRFTQRPRPGNLSTGWHSFSLLWSRSELVWYIDGHAEMIVRRYIPSVPMYFIATLADFSSPGHPGCNGTMLIRSVKVWQH